LSVAKNYGQSGLSGDVEWGNGGPRLKVEGTTLAARNSADGAYTNLRLASPVGADDGMTLGYMAQVWSEDLRYGFTNRTDTSEVTFNDSTYQITLPAVGAWSYWRSGVRYTATGDKVVTLAGSPPTAGVYFVYIDATDGALSATTDSWTLEDTRVPTAILWYNDALTPKYHLAEERHLSAYPRRLHWEHHFSDGTELVDGGAISGYVVNDGDPAGDTDNTFAIEQTVMADEDIKLTLAALTQPNGTATDYIAVTRTGASSYSWYQSATPFYAAPAGYIYWNNGGTATEGQSGKYYCSYLLFTNFQGAGRFMCLSGRGEYATLSEASAESIGQFNFDGFPIAECIVAYKYIWRTDATYTTKGKVALAATPFGIMRSLTAIRNLSQEVTVRVLNDLGDVTITASTLAVDHGLFYAGNGQWVNKAGVVSAGVGIDFYNATPVINSRAIPAGLTTNGVTGNGIQVNTLSKTAVLTAEQVQQGLAVNDTRTFAAWLYNTALGRTTIDSGPWNFNAYMGVSSTGAGRVTRMTRNVCQVVPVASGSVTTTGAGANSRTATISSGQFAGTYFAASATNTTASWLQTPTGLYQITAIASANSATITVPTGYANESAVTFNVWNKLFGANSPTVTAISPAYAEYPWTVAQPAFTVATTDKLGVIDFVVSNNTTTLSVTYNGTARNSRMRTPLVTLHNNLAGLNQGDYLHLTAAQNTTLTPVYTATQGDLLYASGANTWGKFAKSATANAFVKNSGTDNNPAWSTVNTTDLSTAVVGLLKGNGTGVVVASAGSDYQAPLTFSTGLTGTTTITVDLSTGKAGGLTATGGTAASESLTLRSTAHGTKGKILFGTSGYDETTNFLGVGTASPLVNLDVLYNGFTAIRAGAFGAAYATVSVNRANGTMASPTAVALGSYLGIYQWAGYYDATHQAPSAQMIAEASEAWEVSKYGANLLFLTTLTGAATPTERMRLYASTGELQVHAGVTLGTDAATNTAGVLKLFSAGSNAYYTTFTAGTQTANATYTLPTAMPVSNMVLQSTSAGVLSWVAQSSGGTPAGTTGQVQFNSGSSTFAADAGLTWNNTDKRLGLGCADPSQVLEISANATVLEAITAYGTGVTGGLMLQTGRGTRAASTPVLSGDALGTIYFCGVYQNNTPVGYAGAYVQGLAAENWSATAVGTHLQFFTAPKLSTTRYERLRITDAGNVGVNCTDPEFAFEASADASNYFGVSSYGTATDGGFILRHGRGTRASRAALQTGDTLGAIYFSGYFDGSSGSVGVANIKAYATTMWSVSDVSADLRFSTTNVTTTAERMRIGSDGNVGIGATSGSFIVAGSTYANRLKVAVDESGALLGGMACETGAGTSALRLMRANTTLASKSAVANGDTIAHVTALGHDGTDYRTAASIFMEVDGTVATGFMPGRLVFLTSASGSATLVERMRISASGVISASVGMTPATNDGAYLGTTTLGWSDLHLATGGVINWSNGNVTLTHSTGVLTLAGTLDATKMRVTGNGDAAAYQVVNTIYGTGAPPSTSGIPHGTVYFQYADTSPEVLHNALTDLNVGDYKHLTATEYTDLTDGGTTTLHTHAVPTTITLANEGTDTTCFLLFATAATGDLGPKTNTSLALNSATRCITITGSTADGSTNILDLKDSGAASVFTVDTDGHVTKVRTLGYGDVYDIGDSGTAFTMTLSNGQHQKVMMTGNAALTIVDTGNIGDGNWSLEVIQNGTGGYSIVSGTVSGGTVRTAGGTDPVCSAGANAVDTFIIQKRGTIYTVSVGEKGLATWT
jgi:hypothetical protein